jgi:hypothetical protein
MDGDDLERRIGRLRTDARGLSRLALLWRGRPAATPATGADCARTARDPLRRLEPLRRRGGEAPVKLPVGFR